MAIYRLNTTPISRSTGRSAIGSAAYRAGEKLHDERSDKIYDHSHRTDIAHKEILLPENAPEWMGDRAKLWNHVESIETRKDSRLSRDITLTLPRELTLRQNIELAREFAREQLVKKGLVVDLAIHVDRASDGELQPHSHLNCSDRAVMKEGQFGAKERWLNSKETLLSWRKDWAELENIHLARHGHDMRVDHRSYEDQGIDLIPQKKRGPDAFHRQAAHESHIETQRRNGEKLLENPSTILDVLTRQQSTFTHQDIARMVNRYTADAVQFEAVFAKVKALPELVSLGLDDKRQERFTTHDMLQLEAGMMRSAVVLSERSGHAVNGSRIDEVAEVKGLSPEQGRVLAHIVGEGDLKNVVGYAGTGKSRLLGAAKTVWEEAGFRVHGATLSGIAAENLQAGSDIESRTLASRQWYWDRGEELLSSKDILVIDEAGMVGSQHLARVLDLAEKGGAKVVLVGDPEQLQAIQAGASFRSIAHQTGCVELTEIWRQQTDWQRDATVGFATGKTQDAIRQYVDHDHVHVFDRQDEAKRAMVDAWNDTRLSEPDKTQIMLAYTRKDVLGLNEMARGLRQSLGELGEDQSVQTERGERQFAVGEQIYFLKNDREMGVKNGTLGKIMAMEGDGLTVAVKGEGREERSVTVALDNYNHLDYGYAATIHKSQGLTVDRTRVLASDYLDRHATYVAMTRHRDSADLYWSRDVFPHEDKLMSALSRERMKDTAMDYASEDAIKASYATHRGMDTLWETFMEKVGRPVLEAAKSVMTAIHSAEPDQKDSLSFMSPELRAYYEQLKDKMSDAQREALRRPEPETVKHEPAKWDTLSFMTTETRAYYEQLKEKRRVNAAGNHSRHSSDTPDIQATNVDHEGMIKELSREAGLDQTASFDMAEKVDSVNLGALDAKEQRHAEAMERYKRIMALDLGPRSTERAAVEKKQADIQKSMPNISDRDQEMER